MLDTADLAERLYGAPAASAQPEQQQPTRAAASPAAPAQPEPSIVETGDEAKARQADALFAEPDLPDVPVPEGIKAMREADELRRLYSPQGAYQQAIPDDVFAADPTAAGLPAEAVRAAASELREIAGDLQLTTEDVSTLRSVAATLKEAPTAEQRAAWRDEAVEALNREYGAGAAEAARLAAKLATRDPRVARMLEAKGLGDHPRVILQFARLAKQARSQGRL